MWVSASFSVKLLSHAKALTEHQQIKASDLMSIVTCPHHSPQPARPVCRHLPGTAIALQPPSPQRPSPAPRTFREYRSVLQSTTAERSRPFVRLWFSRMECNRHSA